MRRTRHVNRRFGVALWIAAGVLFLMTSAPVSGQAAAAAPLAAGLDSSVPRAEAPAVASAGIGSATRTATAPSAEVTPGLASGGSGPLGLGALAGAAIAAGAGPRERFKRG